MIVGTAYILLFLSSILPTSPYNPEVLDYVLRSLEYLASVHAGVFSGVFYDADPDHPFDSSNSSILEAILKAPRLDYRIAKYVANVSYHEGLEKLPREPSVLLISFGNSVDYLGNIAVFLKLFDPATKVLVFVKQSEDFLLKVAMLIINKLQFSYSVFIDSETMVVFYCNGVNYGLWSRLPHLIYLFEKDRRRMTGRKVMFVGKNDAGFFWNAYWLEETVRYLHTESVELQHDCKGGGELFYQCLYRLPDDRGKFDIIFRNLYMPPNFGRGFNFIITNIPVFLKIAVPRDRALNVAELMSMPFSWQVWILLVVVILCSEVIKHLYPQHFRNDPFLLAVCGFERHNLHLAGRWEKTIFFSLIVLMFFVTSAFEKKIVSLMTNKPAIQKIKTLADLLESNIKFYDDLENNAYLKEQSVVGKMYVQGDILSPLDTIPGVGMFAQSDIIELVKETAIDYERMQPFYVVLDYTSFVGPEIYMTGWRSLFGQTFRLIHGRLVEAGFFNHWKHQWKDFARSAYVGQKSKGRFLDEQYLTLDDMQPAWMVLGIGLSIGIIGFLGENLIQRISPKRLSKSIQNFAQILSKKGIFNRKRKYLK